MSSGVAVVTLPASVTVHDASTPLRAIEAALAQGGALDIDASAVNELDTAAVALLLQARRLAQARGVAITLRGAPEKLRALARLYGVESLLAPRSAGAAGST